jgi:NAD(P)-dependent dehydrogenase (short-subunit alcohol dehydrogenase family)
MINTRTVNSPVHLAGQAALVTGGGGGLGRAFALALAGAGALVAVTGRSAKALAETVSAIERRGGRALALPGDVTEPAGVARIVSRAESELGSLDVLVNNAGVTGPVGPDWRADPEDWWRAFEVNVRGPFLCARAVLPGMLARGRGRIVNVSSGAAFGRTPQMAVYGATKAALTQWTKSLAREVEGQGVVVLAFSPGFVRTPMTEHLLASPDVPKETADHFREAVRERRETPIDRSVEMLLFLVSGRADALSGRFIFAKDDEETLVRRASEIVRDDLHVLGLRT